MAGFLLVISNTLLWAFLRPWYGGMFKDTWLKNNRGLQTAVMILAILPLFVFDFTNIWSWVVGVLLTAWVQFQYWSRGHGPAFDIGTNSSPSADVIERYTDRWYDAICKYWFPYESWFTRPYDALWMFLRYTCPMLVLTFISPLYLLCGIFTPYIYEMSWKKTGEPHLAEIVQGAVFGFVSMIVRLYA